MAHATHINTAAQGAVTTRFSLLVNALRDRLARRRLYNQTLNELSQLSTRELNDLGLSRSNIRSIAHEAAYGN